jgi:hypothetical protein
MWFIRRSQRAIAGAGMLTEGFVEGCGSWQPVREMHTIALTTVRRSSACLRPRLPAL